MIEQGRRWKGSIGVRERVRKLVKEEGERGVVDEAAGRCAGWTLIWVALGVGYGGVSGSLADFFVMGYVPMS